jgi:hypothetical protein
MARAIESVAALGFLAIVAGCSASGAGQQPKLATRSPGWSAVGIPAGPAPGLTPIPAAIPASSPPRSSFSTHERASPSHPRPPSRPRWASGIGAPAFPTPADVDEHSIDAVAVAGATALVSADTAVDADDPQHTAVRAAWAGWLTPDFARRVLTAKIVGPAGIEWDTWYRHRAYLAVTARPSGEDHPPDTATVAARKVVLHEQAVGRDGWRDAPSTVVVVVVLKKVNDVWRIDGDQPS